MDSIQQINAMDRDVFVERFGPIYERSPWVAERVSAQRPLGSVDEIYAAMQKCVLTASHEEQLALIRVHPELLGKLAPVEQISAESRSEQEAVGLDQCSPQVADLMRATHYVSIIDLSWDREWHLWETVAEALGVSISREDRT